jgi:uncharacterized protein
MTAKRHAFCIQLTERCNMACSYCYVRRRERQDLPDCSPEVCERFVDFALREAGDRLKITFFGGEPLLRPDLIRHTVSYAKAAAVACGKEIGFHLVTNGTLLDDATGDYIAEEGMGLEISLDGPEEVHDSNRVFTDGAPTFRVVYGNLLRFVGRHPDSPVSIFSVITSAEPLAWLQALCRGIDARDSVFNPCRPDRSAAKDVSGGLAFRKRIDLHRAAFLSGDQDYDEGIDRQISCLLGCSAAEGCEAGINSTITTQSGLIYPCPFFVGCDDQVIGDIAEGFYPDKVGPYLERRERLTASCRDCEAYRLCVTGCAFDSYEAGGKLDAPVREACETSLAYARSLGESIVELAAICPERAVERFIGPQGGMPRGDHADDAAGPARSFVVRLTGRCNLACDYCYEKGMPHNEADLDYGTAGRIAEAILAGPEPEPLVCLFGGEPLLNWAVGEFLVREISGGAAASGKRPFFHLTTNGTLLTKEIAAAVAHYGITVQISLDGREAIHDRHRRYPDGRGSFADALKGRSLLREADPGAKIDAQVTLTPGNVDMISAASYLRGEGFRRISFLVAGWRGGWGNGDIEELILARQAFFPFFMEAALRGEAEVDMNFAALVAAEPEGPQGLCECGSGELYIDTRGAAHRCPQLFASGRQAALCVDIGGIRGMPDRHARPVREECKACWAYGRCRGGCMTRNQSCPWAHPVTVPEYGPLWCDFMRAEFARAILAAGIMEARCPDRMADLRRMFRR